MNVITILFCWPHTVALTVSRLLQAICFLLMHTTSLDKEDKTSLKLSLCRCSIAIGCVHAKMSSGCCLCIYRLVKLSSPNLNYFIIIGAVLMYISIFFYILPVTNTDVVLASCIVRLSVNFFRYAWHC